MPDSNLQQSTDKELRQQTETGEQAQTLMDNPYFQDLLTRMDKALQADLLSLSADQPDLFSYRQAQRDNLEALKETISHDIYRGEEALKQLAGDPIKTAGRVAG